MKPKVKNIIIISLLVAINFGFILPNFAAAALVPCGQTGLKPCQIKDLIIATVRIINYLLAWAWLIFLLFLIWAGWNMVGAHGNSEKIEQAKSTFSNAIVGFFMVMAMYLLLSFVVSMLTDISFNEVIKFLPQYNAI